MVGDEDADFQGLNCFGIADIAIINGLIHHLIIDFGIDVEEFYKTLSKLYCEILLEFPTKNDPMVKLLINKKNEYVKWDWQGYHEINCLRYFNIGKTIPLSKTRFMVHLSNKNEK